jgi:hypothetical protein
MAARVRIFQAAVFTALMVLPAQAEVHVFTTADGRFLHGELVNVTADQVVMKTSEGPLTLPLKDLIGSDQDYVVTRLQTRVPEVREDFEITCTKEKTKAPVVEHKNAQTDTKTTYVARINLRNKANKATGDLTVQYEIYFGRAQGRNKEAIKHKGGTIPLSSMQPGATTSLDTESFELNVRDLDMGYSWPDGTPPHQADSFKGVALDFMLGDKKVFEYLGPGVAKLRENERGRTE